MCTSIGCPAPAGNNPGWATEAEGVTSAGSNPANVTYSIAGNWFGVAAAIKSAASPISPTNLVATAGNGQVALSWTASNGAMSYNVKRSTTSGGPYTTEGSPTATSYTDTGLTNGTPYYYVVTAVNTAGETANSSQVSATPQAPPPISVSISPPNANLQVGQQLQFSATVLGTTNNSVTWQVNGAAGGNPTVGTISLTGLYTAPAAVPSGGNVKVTAQSVAQTSATGSAPVTINPAPSSISVSILPTSANLQTGQSQPFTATVSGTSNTAVNWAVNGTAGGNATVGTISSAGLYTAPAAVPSGGNVKVTAQSVAQSTATGSATVSITAPTISVSLSPTNPSLQVGQSLQFNATVSGTSNTAVNWLVSNVLGGNSSLGTISSTGLYTAPASVPNAQVTVTAQSAANPASTASASVTITAAIAHQVDLSWTASTSSSVAGYNVYRGTQPAGPFTKINSSLDTSTAYTDATVVSGQTYYYTTTAVDSSGVESGDSNVVQAVVP
jgi:fibronectin type 3 domain-containing protein